MLGEFFDNDPNTNKKGDYCIISFYICNCRNSVLLSYLRGNRLVRCYSISGNVYPYLDFDNTILDKKVGINNIYKLFNYKSAIWNL